MSNGTRKKKVDFKKLLIIEEEPNPHIHKKSSKSINKPQNTSNKKDKSQKISQKQRESKEKMVEQKIQKKIKTKNIKGKDQLNINEFSNKLKSFKEEINFLNKKRNAEINIEKIVNLQKNSANKIDGAISSENKNNIKNKENILNYSDNNNSNEEKEDIIQNTKKNENQNQNSALMTDFYKLYLHLFESNRLDNSKPYKFVDYLITGDNYLFNIKKDKTRFEEIKKGIYIKSKNNNFLINDHLVNKYTYEYLKCDFSHSFMKKLCEKINIFLMNKKKIGNDKDTMSFEKKDKFTYSNFLADKLKDNSNKSILSFTNDTEYFKSLIYVCNKYSKYIGKKEMPEKILIESLDKNKKILEKFKTDEEAKDLAIKEENEYIKDLLRSRKIRKYINKKFKCFDEDIIKTNKIIMGMDINIFYKIFDIILKNKSDDDIDRLYKIFQEELILPNDTKLEKTELKNFLIEFRFLVEIEIAQKKYEKNENNINNISILKKIYDNINKYFLLNKGNNLEDENNSGKKGKIRNRIKLKMKKDLILDNENESYNSNIKNIDLNNNDMNIELNESFYQEKEINIENKNDNKSKIVPFKIPYSKNNINQNNIINNNNAINNNPNINLNPNTKTSLFEINNINENNSPQNYINISLNQNKEENNVHNKINFETEKHENIKSKMKKRRKRENKNTNNESSNDELKLNNHDSNKMFFNNHITFNAIKGKGISDIGKYFLNQLSIGQDIFKLVIDKPKIRNNKENELAKEEKENKKMKESTKEIYRKENETRENSSKSNSKNEKLEKIELIENTGTISNLQSPVHKEKQFEKNIDIINNSDNSMQQITTDYIFSKHKIKNKNKNFEKKRNIDTIKIDNILNNEFNDDNIKEITRNNLIHSPNIGVKITRNKNSGSKSSNNSNSINRYLFSTDKLEQIQNEKGIKNNINIKIDRQSVEIKEGNMILN